MRSLTSLATTLGFIAACSLAHATLPPVSPGERTLFSDDFSDNGSKWTNIAVLNGTGAPATVKAVIAKSTWSPSLQDRTAVTSVATFKTPLILAEGPLSIYMSVRVDDIDGTDNNRFSITLNESAASNRFVRLQIRPQASGSIDYRDETGAGTSTATSFGRRVFTDETTYYTFKLTLTPSADRTGPATAEAFYYDVKAQKYVSIGIAGQAVWLKDRTFTHVSINNRNGDNGLAWFDAVAVTRGAAAGR